MGIAVQNISSTSAIVKWPSAVHCADDFYSIMYHPNWNTLLSSYSRKTFQKEQRVPISQNWLTIENLTPLTTYILCVTCQPANPSNDQCTIFNTMSQETAAVRSKKKDLAMGIWLTSSVLLLIIAGTLLYGCIHVWCRKRQEQAEGFSISSDQERTQAWKTTIMETALRNDVPCNTALNVGSRSRQDTQLGTVTENPFISNSIETTPMNMDKKLAASCKNNG
eukprot:gi/632948241/ref/XP_007889482.1/ PREDICTED: fibronectin type III domain-containing protein 9-like [Callorhinchus milii]